MMKTTNFEISKKLFEAGFRADCAARLLLILVEKRIINLGERT